MWKISELKEKRLRLKELEKFGLNTPIYFYLKKQANDQLFEDFIKWAEAQKEKDPNTIFNVRTYDYGEGDESLLCPHRTDILQVEELTFIVWDLNEKFFCMIDTEIPDNGRLSGNINFYLRNDRLLCAIDYCEKEKRAMVRDADIHYQTEVGKMNHFGKLVKELPILNFPNPILETVFAKAEDFIIKKEFLNKTPSVILEWTYFCKKTGIKKENLVWWEYRLIKE